MKVFIGWSGSRSRQVAFALREWIPSVINDVDAWVSEEDIAKGAHWPTYLGRELDEAKFGIICLTPENLNEPWILFEAGALSKVIETARVSPYLFDVENAQVKPPLGHFQASKAEKDDTRKLMQSINSTLEQSKGRFLSQQRFDAAFEKWWPDLEKQLAAISGTTESKATKRPIEEMLSEILETVRGLARDVPISIRRLQGRTDASFLAYLITNLERGIPSWVTDKPEDATLYKLIVDEYLRKRIERETKPETGKERAEEKTDDEKT
jgi:hypothetical protein